MLDCGIHPGFANEASLPYLDDIDLDEVDVMLVTHFHLDHSAAVPFVVGRTPFKVGSACLTPPPPIQRAWLARVLQCACLQSSQSGAGHTHSAGPLSCCCYLNMRLPACMVTGWVPGVTSSQAEPLQAATCLHANTHAPAAQSTPIEDGQAPRLCTACTSAPWR